MGMKLMLAACAMLLSLLPAFAADKAAPSNLEDGEFQQWLIRRAETLSLAPVLVNLINIQMKDKPLEARLLYLSDPISHDDLMLGRYLTLIEENQKKYGRVSPFDRQLLTVMRRFNIPAKQARIERFQKVTGRLGIKDAPALSEAKSWQDALPAGSATKQRYNPDSGLYERYDDEKKEWVPDDKK